LVGKGTFGKVIVLLLLIIILSIAAILWFDYLGVIQAKSLFAPVYRSLGMEPQTGVASAPEAYADLDADRLQKLLEAYDTREEELNKREGDINRRESEVLQMEQELTERRISQEEREKTFNQTVEKYENIEGIIEQNAQNLTGMPPQNAVAILLAMDDQDMIDVLRKTEEIATRTGAASMVAYWMSLMPADRVAEIQRKMTSKPVTTP
jgi:flagellar protein FlbB